MADIYVDIGNKQIHRKVGQLHTQIARMDISDIYVHIWEKQMRRYIGQFCKQTARMDMVNMADMYVDTTSRYMDR